ncbi:hypothetical protein BBP40_010954, partial [Aspergillus hancockii]
MATVIQDAELMTTYRAAVPVVAGGKFLTFRDGSLHPAVISQGKDGHFVALTNPNSGQRVTHDVVEFFKLPDVVVDFELRQYEDKTSFLFTTWASDDTCGIHLFHSLTAEELWAPPVSKSFHGTVSTPKQLFLSEIVDEDALPAVFMTCPRPDKHDEVVLRPVSADVSDNKLRSIDNWKLRGNIKNILAVTVGVTSQGKGVFVLYDSTREKKRYIQFRNDVVDGIDMFAVDFPVHEKATCLAAYNNPLTDYSALILAGEEISLYVDKHYVYHNAKPTATVPGPLGVTSIHVSQKGDLLSLWYTNNVQAAYYYNTSHDAFADGEVIQFLPDRAGRTVSGMLWEHDEQQLLVQTLTTANDDGFFTVWQQTQVSGYWDEHPFHVDAPVKATPTDSFVLRLQAQNPSDPSVIRRCQMEVTTADLLQCYCNGKSTAIGPVATWHDADENGVLNVIIPTSKITCGNIRVTAIRSSSGGSSIPISTPPLAPSAKAIEKLQALRTGQDVLNAKTQLGDPLVAPGSMTLDRADEIAQALAILHKGALNLATNNSTAAASLAARRRPPFNRFNWFKKAWNKAKGWAKKGVDKIRVYVKVLDDLVPDGPLKIVLHFFEEPLEITLDTFDAILLGIDFVVNLFSTGWEVLKAFLAFLFDWPDIIRTARSVKAWFDSGFDWAAEKIDDLDQLVDHYCDELSNRIKQVPTTDPVSIKSVTDGVNPKVRDLQNSVKYNWAFNVLLYGASGDTLSDSSLTSAAIHPGEVCNLSAVGDAYELIKTLLKDVADMLKNIFEDVKDWFSTDMSITEIFKRLGSDLLEGIVHVAADLVHGLLKAIKGIVNTLHNWANKELVFPILTDLWHYVTGEPLSFTGVISFVLAIPMTLLSKVLTGTAPPDLTFLTKNSWNEHLAQSSSVSTIVLSTDITTALTYFGNLLTLVSTDVNGLSNGIIEGLDAIKAAAAFDIFPNVNLFDLIKLVVKFGSKVLPWSTPWSEQRMTWEHCVVYGIGIVDCVLLGICMASRAGTGIPHDNMAYFASAGSLNCTTLALGLGIIIGVDEVNFNKGVATLQFVGGGLGWVSEGAGFASSATALAEQPLTSAGLTALSVGTLYFALWAKGGEIACKYYKTTL